MKREEDARRTYIRSVVIGCGASAILLMQLLFISLFSDKHHMLIDHSVLTSKISLLIVSFLCSLLCAGKLRQKRLFHSLTGNGVILFCLIIVGIMFGFFEAWSSVLVDFGIVLFGTFAGAILQTDIKRKRRVKR